MLSKSEQSLNSPTVTAAALEGLKKDLSTEAGSLSNVQNELEGAVTALSAQQEQAETRAAELSEQVPQAEQACTEADKGVKDAQGQLKNTEAARNQADEALSASNAEYKTACDTVKQREGEKTKAQQGVSNAKQNLAQAKGEADAATSSYNSLQAELNSTPATLEDGKPNPKHAQLETAVAQALQKKEAAEAKVQEEEGKLQEANNALNEATKALGDAQTAKQTALDNVNSDKEEVSKMKENCKRCQEAVQQKQADYDKALEAKDAADEAYTEIQAELTAQEGVVENFKTKSGELEEIKAHQGKIDELNSKIDTKAQEVKKQEADDEQKIMASFEKHIDPNGEAGYDKTIKENLLSMSKRSDYGELCDKVKGDMWLESRLGIDKSMGQTADDLRRAGYVENKDGSFTDPRSGVTMVNVGGTEWMNTAFGNDPNYIYANQARVRYPGIQEAGSRNSLQKFYDVSYNSDGSIYVHRNSVYDEARFNPYMDDEERSRYARVRSDAINQL